MVRQGSDLVLVAELAGHRRLETSGTGKISRKGAIAASRQCRRRGSASSPPTVFAANCEPSVIGGDARKLASARDRPR
jgi:hypothetical protein